jgi:hypothetical protein
MADSGVALWTGGRVYTGSRIVEAMAVEEGRVVALGSEAAVRRNSGRGSERHDLQGGSIIPGLVDSHVHVLESVLQHRGVDLRGVRTRSEFEQRVRAWVDAHPRSIVFGGGWDQETLEGRRWPDRSWIDEVVPGRPAVLDRVCTHAALLNSVALEEVGIDRKTHDPPGGTIGRGPDGAPDGLLLDRALDAARPLRDAAFLESERETRTTLAGWSRFGITSVGAMNMGPREVAHLRSLHARDPLPIRIHGYLRLESLEPGSHPEDPKAETWIAAVGVKVILDGALGIRTAWLSSSYSDAPGELGRPTSSIPATAERLARVVEGGWTPALHAIGDRAVAEALTLLERLGNPKGARIEHLSMVPPVLLDRIAHSGVVAVVQPQFRISDSWVPERLGAERAQWTYRFRSLLDAGVPLAGSSDGPVEPVDPWAGCAAAVREGGGSVPGEAVTPEEALAMYTTGGGRALSDPNRGRLRVGGPADFVRLRAATPFPAFGARRSPVAETWVGGRRAFPRATASGRRP